MKLKFTGFEWDEGNTAKCLKHGLSVEEIEVFFKEHILSVIPDIKHSTSEGRLTATGRMENGRPVFVVFTMRGSLIRPVTARYMHQKEVIRYEK